ncbi:hypothetical protein LCGC14_0946670 [marine sediment metagenome]|uniref:Uncharacterized protein n=1 Tax=marine sediment metagenome TaxID=412755 RepID=A0A0F9P4L2_9ZZZZ
MLTGYLRTLWRYPVNVNLKGFRMEVYIVVKKDCTGLHICRVFINILSAEAQSRAYKIACKYDATYEVKKFRIF